MCRFGSIKYNALEGGTILHEGLFNDRIYSLRVEVIIAHQGPTDRHFDLDGNHDKTVDYRLLS